MLENKELIISLVLTISVSYIMVYILYRGCKQSQGTLSKTWIHTKGENMRLRMEVKRKDKDIQKKDKFVQALTLKHSGLISKLRNDKTLSKQTREYIKEYI